MKVVSTFLLAALMSMAASQAFAQSNDAGRALVPSSTIRLAADTERCSSLVSKEFIVPYAGTVRVAYLMKSDGSHNGSVTVQSAIHLCQDEFTTSGAYALKVCDVRVAAGDFVRISAAGATDINPPFLISTVCLKNAHVLYNVINATGLGRVIRN